MKGQRVGVREIALAMELQQWGCCLEFIACGLGISRESLASRLHYYRKNGLPR
jgi:hypothetical protein